jgi:hypothetical protein
LGWRGDVLCAARCTNGDTPHRVDLTATSRQANHGVGKDQALGFAMTPGARWMAFVSASTNMILPATNSFEHTYLRGPLY